MKGSKRHTCPYCGDSANSIPVGDWVDDAAGVAWTDYRCPICEGEWESKWEIRTLEITPTKEGLVPPVSQPSSGEVTI